MLDIVKELKNKKELRDLDGGFIKNRIEDYLKLKKVDFSNKKSKSYKEFFKDIRKKLRDVYGSFKIVKCKRDKKFYKIIFKETCGAKKILNLGCGLDPLEFPFKDFEYYACDISHDNIKKVNDYFKKNKIKGKAFIFNLVDEDVKKLPKAEIVFIFRVLESLEAIKKDISYKIIKNLKCKNIVVSFDKKALGGKKTIKKKGRKWFRLILKKLGYEHKVIDYKDEIVFVIKK